MNILALIRVIFSAHDTTASVLTWVLKYLQDNGTIMAILSCKIDFLHNNEGYNCLLTA
jgi:hypothetical protein